MRRIATQKFTKIFRKVKNVNNKQNSQIFSRKVMTKRFFYVTIHLILIIVRFSAFFEVKSESNYQRDYRYARPLYSQRRYSYRRR